MRTVIFANGVIDDVEAELAAYSRADDVIVAADGGARYALEAGLRLAHVIGDLDSLDPAHMTRFQRAGTAVHRAAVDKDETDLELALLWAASQPDVDQAVVLGAFGGRPDQTLANLLLLALPELTSLDVLMVSGAWTVRIVRSGDCVKLHGSPGDLVSLVPLGGAAHGVSTDGLAFALDAETLALGPARGVSNRLERKTAWVTVMDGLLWCFHERTSLAREVEGSDGS